MAVSGHSHDRRGADSEAVPRRRLLGWLSSYFSIIINKNLRNKLYIVALSNIGK